MFSGYTYKFYVGMTCTNCVAKINAELSKQSLIDNFEIDLQNKKVKVITKTLVHPDQIKKLLSKTAKTELIYSPGEVNSQFESDWSIDLPKNKIHEILTAQKWLKHYEFDELDKRVRIHFLPGTANNEEQKLTLVNRAFKLVKARRIENHHRIGPCTQCSQCN